MADTTVVADGNVEMKNVSRRMLTLVLDGKHLAAAPVGHPNRYKKTRFLAVHQGPKGSVSLHTRAKVLPDSLRISAGETVRVHPDVMFCPSVLKALASGQLKKLADAVAAKPVDASTNMKSE